MIAAHHDLAVTSRVELRERCYGKLEGRSLEEAEQSEGEWVTAWMADRQRIAPPGGETQAQMSERVMAALREIAGSHPGEIVAVGTHGGPIKSAVFHILGAPVERWSSTFVANGSITILRGTPDMLRLASFNDTWHLDAEEPGEADTEG
jgi:broad specificity phosphatase PhoE